MEGAIIEFPRNVLRDWDNIVFGFNAGWKITQRINPQSEVAFVSLFIFSLVVNDWFGPYTMIEYLQELGTYHDEKRKGVFSSIPLFNGEVAYKNYKLN